MSGWAFMIAALLYQPTPPPPLPPPPRRTFISVGLGARPCREWSSESPASLAWLAGYLTALNEYGPNPRGDLATDASFARSRTLIDRYCADHPEKPISWAAGQAEEDLLQDARLRGGL